MSSSLQPITLYAHGHSPNPVKVAIILEELGLPYKKVNLDGPALKQEPFISINPNGRAPAIEDPNTGITLWESGAIIQYLVETYDAEHHKLSYPATAVREYHQLNQWLMFQVSGQGPYFGQATWFLFFHPEKLPSAIERYLNEIERVTGVLDSWLAKHEFLVGDKVTYADLSFVPYAALVAKVPILNRDGKLFVAEGEEGGEKKEKYPAYTKWLDTLMARPAVSKVMEQFAAAAASIH
ncbi:glutathione S-transferase [Capronia coronata CBS 617.96]|uniref:Glutathione S-transferase n=1 Tax=Capronia coronata CBS 617.96 TaxID=1182541 RepID=W9YQK6_9EURO|nr:glutathione S-transferase [Capronia coronata CBS 617.96]EXJ95202.1 glutathione S-transferase [Capronia coronata CBS 617.96]